LPRPTCLRSAFFGATNPSTGTSGVCLWECRRCWPFTQIFERRIHKRFTSELHQSDLPAPARKAFEIMIADESDHLEWVLGWLRKQADSEVLLRKYQAIDLAVYHDVLFYEYRLWEMAGLGEELPSRS
jgi:hypothetical protein